jgi:hypothetical protein
MGETPSPKPETGALPGIRGRNYGLAACSIVILFFALSTKLFSIIGHWLYTLPPFFR